ncbi:hypothetical protein KSF_108390 [Reticulibacter mediterranei]|uniref:Uncharacterized protein n=1 Tax=Reticulibacter mediterranei TaxID=2778369 RepID=A0A8J3J4Y3_9CHLR|nr:hypothetical protein [Reticulibacter mediterranei]GHP00792.1 hypothetical protein KSF_108390 [Reticulibacter mediterranei]
MSIDGGLTALGGFLYQTVVALSLKADTFQAYDDAPHLQDDLETLLGFATDGTVRYEDVDQDITIKNVLHDGQPGYILVQVKYSSRFPRPSLNKSDMTEIMARLQASEEKVRAREQHVTAYSLLTNRPLTTGAEDVKRTSHLPFYTTSSLPERYGEERLRQFARRFGCINAEIEDGILRGIGDLLQRTTHPRYNGEPVITREMLIELFTGTQQAHMLSPEIVLEKSQQQLSNLFHMP